MAGFADIFGGAFGGGLYGDMLTPQQQQALAQRSLLGFLGGMQKSGALDYTAPFISGKVPAGFAAGLAGGMAGMGEAQDQGAITALKAAQLGQQGQQIKSDMALKQALMKWLGLDSALSATPTDPIVPEAPRELAAPMVKSGGSLGGGLAAGGALTGGVDRITGNWEVDHNNFGGLRKPGIIAGPRAGGFQAFATPEDGLTALSRQLDRYASGATTGKPLRTIRQIVSTWAPPHENDTRALIARAVKVVGVDPDTPLDLSDPAVKAKMMEATVRNEFGNKLPVSPDLISKVAGATTSAPRPVQMAQAAPQAAPAFGSLAPPIPQPAPSMMGRVNLNDPRQVMMVGILGDLLKIPSIGSLLTSSPQFQAAQELAKRLAVLPLIGPEAAAKASGERGVTEPSDMRLKSFQAELDALLKKKEQERAAALDMTTITVPGPGGVPREIPVTREQAVRATQGLGVPELGIPPATPQQPSAGAVPGAPQGGGLLPGGAMLGKPVGVGAIPPSQQLVDAPEGPRLVNIPGGSAAAAAVEQEKAQRISTDIVTQNIGRGLKLAESWWATGAPSLLAKHIPNSAADQLANTIGTIEANVFLDRLQQQRKMSPTGAAVGNVTEKEGDQIRATLGNLKQAQRPEDVQFNLKRIHNLYMEAVDGSVAELNKGVAEGKITPAARDAALSKRYDLSEYEKLIARPGSAAGPAMRPPVATTPIPPASSGVPPNAAVLRSEAADAIAKGAPRDAVIKRLQSMGIDPGGL